MAKLTALLGKVDDDSDDETEFSLEFPIKSEEQLESLEERIMDNVVLQHKLVCFLYNFILKNIFLIFLLIVEEKID